MHLTIVSFTSEGRDRSLDYKITGFSVPKGNFDDRVSGKLAAAEDEIYLSKSSPSAFMSTQIYFFLHNFDVAQLANNHVLTAAMATLTRDIECSCVALAHRIKETLHYA